MSRFVFKIFNIYSLSDLYNVQFRSSKTTKQRFVTSRTGSNVDPGIWLGPGSSFFPDAKPWLLQLSVFFEEKFLLPIIGKCEIRVRKCRGPSDLQGTLR